jgi:excisionase family DNA binding protein
MARSQYWRDTGEVYETAKVSSDLINIEDVAEMLGVSVSTIHVWRAKGTTPIKFAYFGRRVKARRSQVEQYIAEQFGETAE